MRHGGARPGAGRKPAGPATVPVNWRVSEHAKAWVKAKAAEDGVSIGAVLDELVKHYEAVNSAVKIADNAINLGQMCAEIEKKISDKVLEKIHEIPVTYMYPEAQMEIEKLRICATYRRPARINNKVVLIGNFNVQYDPYNIGKMNMSFDALPLDEYDEEYVLDIDVNKLR